MDNPQITFARIVDVRPGERRLAFLSFWLLLLISTGYAVLETARDALLVTHVSRGDFGLVYIAVAVLALPMAGLLARLGLRHDPRRVLLLALAASCAAALTWYAFPVGRASVVAFYVIVALVASSVFPQFWLLMGGLLTVGQSRRLFAAIGSAAGFGGAIGSGIAAVLVPRISIGFLPLLSGVLFAASVALAFCIPSPPPKPQAVENGPVKLTSSLQAMRAEPFLFRVALLVVITTATALAIDYFFKWTIARSIPDAERGTFVARYYALVNILTLAVQLLLGTALVRRLGVVTALELNPVVSLAGGTAALIGGAAVAPVLVLKAADASLRSSINRLTTELVYLPASPQARSRAKPFIDGALTRIAQALAAGMLFALSRMQALSPTSFGLVVVVLAVAWLGAAFAIRPAYLKQLRLSVASSGTRGPEARTEPLDIRGAELLVESLGSEEPAVIIASMSTLSRRGETKLLPSLILRHTDERVIERALEILGTTTRTDWHRLATDLLGHASERVRIAAARALATHGKLDVARLASDSASAVRGYVTLLATLTHGAKDVVDDARVEAVLLDSPESSRLGLLAAIADAPPSASSSKLIAGLAARDGAHLGRQWWELLASGAGRLHDVALIPILITLHSHREAREPARRALVELGEPALQAVAQASADPAVDRKIRVHLPQTLARFGTQSAADKLLEALENEKDGRVRYKVLRALGRVVAGGEPRVERARIERLMRATLVAYLRLLATRVALGVPPPTERRHQRKSYDLLVGLIDDKLRQSLERAFRLLKIARPREDIRRVYLAYLSADHRARANAGEFLDALLRGRDQEPLRELLRLVIDDLAAVDKSARSAELLGAPPPHTREEALRAAVADPDIKLATLAALHVRAMGDSWLGAAIEVRPGLATAARDLFQEALIELRESHV